MAYEELSQIINESDNIVFFGGAGVSTESNIPDFRSDDGVYNVINKYGVSVETLLSHSYFMKHTNDFYKYYKENLIFLDAQPNRAHLALAKLEEQGKLNAVITQNIDNLHQMAGSKNVLELHGSVYRNYCMNKKCKTFYTVEEISKMDGVPTCPKCGGIIRPDVVLYEESLDQTTIKNAIHSIQKCDVLIIGGTSLVVYPAAGLVDYFTGRKLILINKDSTPFDQKADLVINDSLGKVLGDVCGI